MPWKNGKWFTITRYSPKSRAEQKRALMSSRLENAPNAATGQTNQAPIVKTGSTARSRLDEFGRKSARHMFRSMTKRDAPE